MDNMKSKRVNGVDLNSKCFLIVGDESDTSTWKLPVFDPASAARSRNLISSALHRSDQLSPIHRAMLVGAATATGVNVDPRILALINVETQTAAEPEQQSRTIEVIDPELEEVLALADRRCDLLLRQLGLN